MKEAEEKKLSIEQGLEKLDSLTRHINNNSTPIASAMDALRESTKLSKQLGKQLSQCELSLKEIADEIEKQEQQN